MTRIYSRLLVAVLVLAVAAGLILLAGGYRSSASTLSTEGRTLSALQADNAETRLAAVKNLNSTGEMSAAAVTALTPLLSDSDPQVSYNAALALGNSSSPAARAALMSALNSSNELVRVRAAEALAVNPTAEAVPALSRLLLNGDAAAAQAAVALAKIDTPEAHDALWRSLADEQSTTRQRAAMNALAAQGKAALPMLKQAQLSGIPSLQGNATQIIERIERQ